MCDTLIMDDSKGTIQHDCVKLKCSKCDENIVLLMVFINVL